MLIDTHCHLNFHAFAKDLSEVVRRAREKGVEKIIVPGTDLTSSRRAVEIAHTYPGICYAAVGIHPHHAQNPNFKIDDNVRHQLGELLKERGVVAVGEVGLDYYRYKKTKYENSDITADIKQKQKDLLLLQLDLALIHNKPVILHCRDAYRDMLDLVSNYSRNPQVSNNYINQHQNPVKTNYIPAQGWSALGGKPSRLIGVFHCFSGSTQDLELILTMGYYVGFDGNITYNKNQYSPLVASVPLNRLLLETDSPYLTPVPHRGTRNEPAYIPLVAQAVAKYHDSPLSEVIHISTKSVLSFFDLN